MTVLTHERKHSSVSSGVYKRIQNFERKVKRSTYSAYHEVRIILFLLNLKFCGVITNKCAMYIFSTMETSHLFHFFIQFVVISYCHDNLNKNSKLYQQNLQF
jgi:hypothetical protein